MDGFKVDSLEVFPFDRQGDVEISLGEQPPYENDAYTFLNEKQVEELIEFLQKQLKSFKKRS